MNTAQVERFVMRFLEAYNCRIIEKTKHAVIVNLSPEADKELTGRSYYWSFVERTGVEPETMTYRFVFDPEGDAAASAAARPVPAGPRNGPLGAAGPQPGAAERQAQEAAGPGNSPPGGLAAASAGPAGPVAVAGAVSAAPGAAAGGGTVPAGSSGTPSPQGTPAAGATGPAASAGAVPGGAAPAAGSGGSPPEAIRSADSILGRYFGTAPAPPVGRVPRDEVIFGSRRLQQLFATALNNGRFTRLFEAPPQAPGSPLPRHSAPLTYCSWMNVNYKVEYSCDMKRSEVHSLAIQMTTGEIREEFHPSMLTRKLAPKLPANIHLLGDNLTLSRAASILEDYLEQKIRRTDLRWADRANQVLAEEHQLVRLYYEGMLTAAEPEAREELEIRYAARQAEVDWQYRPRVHVSVINCGLFHLRAEER
ncbi:YqhG family protein [Paenibacillus chitinolyticus]|uniref:YqhG family protein n=1 Tax=Paenibacillus chitinolyticus TaxID=79263 RepID=UPI0036262576